ncbi:hypothetical protein [Streptomyces collinus]|uniref:hypothetical protein n=1 Tax=Streptomyces collinus TaxID=42684 RepID=UPI0036E6BBA6
MTETWGSLTVAAVGVLGTLGAALLTQVRADRAKRLELEAAVRQRLEDRAHDQRMRDADRAEAREQRNAARLTEAQDRLRVCYISFNTAARQYQTAQVNVVHALRDGTPADECAEELETCRTAFRASYAEAQMLVPGPVLDAASGTSRRLNEGYGELRHLLAAAPGTVDRERLRRCERRVQAVWAQLSALRRAMRRDLGVDDPES